MHPTERRTHHRQQAHPQEGRECRQIRKPKGARLIEVEDAEVQIEHHPEDWLAFAVFWALAAIVFLQFFTRYVLNDSVAWTEEIARYGLIWVTFIGAVMVTRRNSHIAVALLPNLLPAWAGRACSRWWTSPCSPSSGCSPTSPS